MESKMKPKHRKELSLWDRYGHIIAMISFAIVLGLTIAGVFDA